MARPIIIDTDPGQDDAIAILLALASPELKVLGLTAVAGNVPLHLTELNCRRLLALANRTDVPVAAGCSRPMVRRLVTAEQVHGETGLDGADLPMPTVPLDPRHAVDFIIETVLASPEPVTLCPLGPLTNIGMALVTRPEIAKNLREIVLMGGAMHEPGNTTPVAEFNIYVDPHAAHLVFESGVPVTMMPLDVTHRALTTPERLARLRAKGTPVTTASADLLQFYGKFDEDRYGFPGAPLHDPCTIAYLLKPELFTGRTVNVSIEHLSELTMGQTVCDWWSIMGKTPNAQVFNRIDADGFYDLVIERLARL
ncbi:MAG TPA: nucleoside hydrolase [Alphaproteobacteria bacterium]|nr:nucleoside hydrolase [Alphaproteobacteria bacterium]